MDKVFDNLKELIESCYLGNKILKHSGEFYLNEVRPENKVEVPEHYKCSCCGIVKGKPAIESLEDPVDRGHGNITVNKECCGICRKIIIQ